jgi:CRP/FNR family cyclic AMP-dependent transcriptional regulator
MSKNRLGKIYVDKETIFNQGELGNCMFAILSGRVEVVRQYQGKEMRIAELEKGDIFGEMALFEKMPRSATVRALGEARILTIDKRTFFSRVHEDPSLAFNILKKMSQRISRMNNILTQETIGSTQ